MKWQRVAPGIYRSNCSFGYVVERKGVGLFQGGWRPSWHLTEDGRFFVGEYESLKKAKAVALEQTEIMNLPRSELINNVRPHFLEFVTSLHEAAHILINWLTCNLPIHSASIIQEGDFGGHVDYIPPRNPDAETARGMAMVGIAGSLAEKQFCKMQFDWRSLNEYDMSLLTEYGRVVRDGDFENHVRAITQETASLLTDNWFKLRYLQHVLKRRRTMTGRQIRAVLRRADMYLPLRQSTGC